jgi:hypothetical protein
MPGIRRIETFTNGTALYRLENRQETVNGSIEMAKYWIHTSKSDKSDEIHSQWISTLSEGVIVMYSDGSKSNSGHTGAGWAIFKMEREGLIVTCCTRLMLYWYSVRGIRCGATCYCGRTTTY